MLAGDGHGLGGCADLVGKDCAPCDLGQRDGQGIDVEASHDVAERVNAAVVEAGSSCAQNLGENRS